jgi:hypothetical protein
MTSPVSGLKETRLSRGTRLEKFMKRKTRTHKTSLQGIATRAARLPVFAVSLATLRFGLFANTDIQATGDIVWVTAGNSIAAYYANGTALPSFNLITEQSWPSPGGILVSGHSLYVPSDWWACCPNRAFVYALLKREAYYVFTTYNADTGSVTGSSWYTISAPFVPTGMAQSSTNLYVANQQGSIAKGGNLYFIKSIVTKAPYALARWVG